MQHSSVNPHTTSLSLDITPSRLPKNPASSTTGPTSLSFRYLLHKGLSFLIFWGGPGHTWQSSGLNPMFRGHAWQSLKNHMWWCQGLNQSQSQCKESALTPCFIVSSPYSAFSLLFYFFNLVVFVVVVALFWGHTQLIFKCYSGLSTRILLPVAFDRPYRVVGIKLRSCPSSPSSCLVAIFCVVGFSWHKVHYTYYTKYNVRNINEGHGSLLIFISWSHLWLMLANIKPIFQKKTLEIQVFK